MAVGGRQTRETGKVAVAPAAATAAVAPGRTRPEVRAMPADVMEIGKARVVRLLLAAGRVLPGPGQVEVARAPVSVRARGRAKDRREALASGPEPPAPAQARHAPAACAAVRTLRTGLPPPRRRTGVGRPAEG